MQAPTVSALSDAVKHMDVRERRVYMDERFRVTLFSNHESP